MTNKSFKISSPLWGGREGSITEIIIHCSATIEGKDFTVEDITRWHRARGFRTIGYHYVIYRDGTIHNGRPESQVGAHCLGHNQHSILICYIGDHDTNHKPKDIVPLRRSAPSSPSSRSSKCAILTPPFTVIASSPTKPALASMHGRNMPHYSVQVTFLPLLKLPSPSGEGLG